MKFYELPSGESGFVTCGQTRQTVWWTDRSFMHIALQRDQYALHLAPLLTTSYISYVSKLASN